jgi:hypothetical protein
MLWASLTGLLWLTTALPVAIAISSWLRRAGVAAVAEPRTGASWTEDVSQFLKEQAASYRPSGPAGPTTS